MDRIFRFLGRIFPFLKRPPGIAAIGLAIVVVGAGFIIGKYGVVEPLEHFTKYLDDSLKSFNASTVARTFYSELTGCELTGFDGTSFAAVCKPAGDQALEDLRCARTGECEPETGFLGSVFLATVNTLAALWSGSTWLGVLIYAGALVLSGIWLAGRIRPEGEPFLWLVWLVLVPAVASLAALGLSWLLALFSSVLSQALAGVAWVIATFGGAIALFKAGMQVFSTAHRIEDFGEDVPGSDKGADKGKRAKSP